MESQGDFTELVILETDMEIWLENHKLERERSTEVQCEHSLRGEIHSPSSVKTSEHCPGAVVGYKTLRQGRSLVYRVIAIFLHHLWVIL